MPANNPPTIWIDADSVPGPVREIVLRAAHRLSLTTILVANQRVQIPPGHPTVSSVRVEGGPDVADKYIADNSVEGDVTITHDIPLAAILVEKKVVVIDPRGIEHTENTIGERLSVRDFMENLRSVGVDTGGPAAYSAKDKQAFASAFDRVVTRRLR
ncbi:MAG: YaiI/YqxD family protein [Gemmatimonadota bacterium]|nr:YaiI/YqxD family protein [Gemmatimonadota bacterium]